MFYKKYEDLSRDIKNNLHRLPDVDLVVGVPRSGMIPAYMIGFLLNIPVCSLNEFVNGCWNNKSTHRSIKEKDVHNVLIIDDSCGSGRAITETKEKLKSFPEYRFFFWVCYMLPGSESCCDGYFEILTWPRMFQWNYLNHPLIESACFDIDGVLCYDPKPEENDDGEKYRKFLLNAKPLFIPKYKIKALVTSRLEKYRKETEKWLKDNGVLYEKLYMLDLPNQAERIKQNAHAKFKAKIYKQLDSPLFYESEYNQAQEIFELTNKPVFCVDNDTLIQSAKQATNQVSIQKDYKCRIRFLGITLFSKRKKGNKRIYRILGLKFVLHKRNKK